MFCLYVQIVLYVCLLSLQIYLIYRLSFGYCFKLMSCIFNSAFNSAKNSLSTVCDQCQVEREKTTLMRWKKWPDNLNALSWRQEVERKKKLFLNLFLRGHVCKSGDRRSDKKTLKKSQRKNWKKKIPFYSLCFVQVTICSLI